MPIQLAYCHPHASLIWQRFETPTGRQGFRQQPMLPNVRSARTGIVAYPDYLAYEVVLKPSGENVGRGIGITVDQKHDGPVLTLSDNVPWMP